MSDAPTWYDLLDVPRDASADAVRAAWKERTADLEPGDRRFDTLNRAARVLLDPAARSAYDASLPADEAEEGARPTRWSRRAPRPTRWSRRAPWRPSRDPWTTRPRLDDRVS